MANMSIRTFVEKFEAGLFEDPARSVQCEAGWYDWFCRDESLRNKTRVLGRKVVQLSKSSKINIDTMYVFFKNNCPVDGSLYDSFSICDIATGDVCYWIAPRLGYNGVDKGKPQVSSYSNLVPTLSKENFENWKEVLKEFGV